jgi:hypothetical protein
MKSNGVDELGDNKFQVGNQIQHLSSRDFKASFSSQL